jgi:hypothetical protein
MKKNTSLLLVAFICSLNSILEQPVFSQGLANNPEVRKAYYETLKMWENDPSFRQSQYGVMEVGCNKARARKRSGGHGLDDPASLANETTAVLISQKKWRAVGIRLASNKILRDFCPDAI